MLGKNRKMIRSITHQLSLSTNPLTVLLTPPNSSPTGSAGNENGTGAADLLGISAESRLRTDEAAGEAAGDGVVGHGAGGGTILKLAFERL